MRGITAKRIRKNVSNAKVLIEVSNNYGERTKDLQDGRGIYQAAKVTYKLLRKNGEHKKANIFLTKEKSNVG